MIRIDLIIVTIIFIWVLWRVRIGFISSFTVYEHLPHINTIENGRTGLVLELVNYILV